MTTTKKNKQLQTNNKNKTVNRSMSIRFTLALMLASLIGQGQTAYIANYGDNTVSVINVANNTVVDTITVGAVGYLPYLYGNFISSFIQPQGIASYSIG